MYTNELKSIDISNIKGITGYQKTLLNKIKIFTVFDLLYYFPFRYEDRTKISSIQDGLLNEINITTIVTVIEHQSIYFNRRKHPKILVQDKETRAYLVAFNRPYIKKSLVIGKQYWLNAQFVYKFNEIQASSFTFEAYKTDKQPKEFGMILPVYRTTEKLTQKKIHKIMKSAIQEFLRPIDDELPEYILSKYKLSDKTTALKTMHFPENFILLKKARYRLAYEELLAIQLSVSMKRNNIKAVKKVFAYNKTDLLLQYTKSLPFSLTNAQTRVIREITKDMQSSTSMHRLLQGDVGSGKTIVAVCAIVLAINNNYQTALMVPTEVLALQHYNKIKTAIEPLGINTVLLTGSLTAKEKQAVYAMLENGEIDLVIGTHALFQKDVRYKNLSLIVIDEQHKFGVEQRIALSKKATNPDILVMTATPIPRTLTLTVYGDLDVSVIDEMPANRKPIKTKWITKEGYNAMLKFVGNKLRKKQQTYFIYPLIEESETLNTKAATQMYDNLRKHFKDYTTGLIHGRIKSDEKDQIMQDFKTGKIDVLISTTVIEVGIDVPNASVIIIENSERFGLSQLHQLRGRVGRGIEQSYCILVTTDFYSEETEHRMSVMVKYIDGFKISEEDLKLRGPGEILGVRQSGMPEIRFSEFLYDDKLLLQARAEAQAILDKDPLLELPENRRLYEGIVKFLPTDYLKSG